MTHDCYYSLFCILLTDLKSRTVRFDLWSEGSKTSANAPAEWNEQFNGTFLLESSFLYFQLVGLSDVGLRDALETPYRIHRNVSNLVVHHKLKLIIKTVILTTCPEPEEIV